MRKTKKKSSTEGTVFSVPPFPIALSPPATRSARWFAAAIVAAILLAWGNSFSAPFVLDDHPSILGNASLRDFWSFAWMTPPDKVGETVGGRPVLNLSFAINEAVGGLDVRGFHAVNLLIHVLAALVLFGLVRRTLRLGLFASDRFCGDEKHRPGVGDSGDNLRPKGAKRTLSSEGIAFFAALIWALHPLQTAAVTYVSQRAESLAGLFYLLTLYAFLRASEPRGARARWSAVCVGVCLLGMGTKETMATAPLVILLYDRAWVAGSFRAAWRARGRLYGALAATWLPLAVLVAAGHGRGGSAGLGSAIGPWTYFLTQCGAIVHYLRLAFWPGSQVFDYGVPTVAGFGAVWLPFLFLGGLAVGTLWALRKNLVVGFLGAAFFLLLAPSSSFVPVATQTMAEHRMYLPLAALVMLAGLGVSRIARAAGARWLAPAGAAVVALALGVTTFARNHVYRSALSLWQDTVAKCPENPRAHNNLGIALVAAGHTEQGMAEFRRTIALQPNHGFAQFNLGVELLKQGQLADAARHFQAALAADPHYVSAHINLGQTFARLGRTDEAIAHYRAALAQEPGAQDARTNLAALLIGQGRLREAESLLREVMAAAPEQPEARYQFGVLLDKSGQGTAAEAQFREAVRLQPTFAAAHLALGNCLAQRGEWAPAEASYREALRFDPKSAEAHYALGNVWAKEKRFAAAMDAYREALRIDPMLVQAKNNLANCQLVTGNFPAAIENYREVLRSRPDDATVRQNLELARELSQKERPIRP
jgi:tetratricopeptide (TPR) repeat protein